MSRMSAAAVVRRASSAPAQRPTGRRLRRALAGSPELARAEGVPASTGGPPRSRDAPRHPRLSLLPSARSASVALPRLRPTFPPLLSGRRSRRPVSAPVVRRARPAWRRHDFEALAVPMSHVFSAAIAASWSTAATPPTRPSSWATPSSVRAPRSRARSERHPHPCAAPADPTPTAYVEQMVLASTRRRAWRRATSTAAPTTTRASSAAAAAAAAWATAASAAPSSREGAVRVPFG